MATTIKHRNWTCTFCGYNRNTTESYYSFRKAYSAHYQASEKHKAFFHEWYANHPEYTKPTGIYN